MYFTVEDSPRHSDVAGIERLETLGELRGVIDLSICLRCEKLRIGSSILFVSR